MGADSGSAAGNTPHRCQIKPNVDNADDVDDEKSVATTSFLFNTCHRRKQRPPAPEISGFTLSRLKRRIRLKMPSPVDCLM